MIIEDGNRSRSRLSPTNMVRELSKEYQQQHSRSPLAQMERVEDYSGLKQKYLKKTNINNESYEFEAP